MNLFDFLRFKQQAPTSKPPKGYYDLRVSKASGALVLVDNDGTESSVGAVTSVAGRTGAVTIASADITDATADGSTTPAKVLKTTATGGTTVAILNVDYEGTPVFAIDATGVGVALYNGAGNYVSLDAGAVTGTKSATLPNVSGTVAVVTSYDDEAAANTAEAANVLYYNVATGKFQITTA